MPRNSSGTHTLPTGQPVISGTVISATTHNALAGDISAELTDSLSRSGKGAMTAPLRTPDGTKTAPAHAFSNETGSGVYRAGAGDVRHAVLGVDALKLSNTGAAVPGTLDVTGAATMGGTLGVTGESTFTGAAGFSAAPTFNSGAFVAAGGFTFSATGDQTIAKTGGNLNINVPTGQVLGIQLNGVTKWQMDGTGKFGGDGTNVITGVALPSGASDVATKGYVDSAPPALTPFGLLGTNWTAIAGSTSYTRKGGFVSVSLAVRWTGATSTPPANSIATLPAGYLPLSADVYALAPVNNGASIVTIRIATSGTISVFNGTMNLNDYLYLNVVFPGA